MGSEMCIRDRFSRLKWQDLDGNTVLGETELQSLILRGKVSNASDVRDVFVHLNDEKVFYSANLNSSEDRPDQQSGKEEFLFSTILKLVPGKNQISVFSRNRYGTTSERRLRILRRQ